MAESLKAFVIIICLSIPVALACKNYLIEAEIDSSDYWHRYGTWASVTAAAFLTFNFWIYIVVAGAITYWATPRDKQPYLLWIAVFLAVPGITRRISGLGLVQQLFAIDYVRLIALTILTPVALSLHRKTNTRIGFTRYADIAIISYVALQLALRIHADTLTNTIRFAFYAALDIGLPYYIASRSINDIKTLKQIIYTIWFTCLLMAALATFEVMTDKLLYESLQGTLKQYWGLGHNLLRGATMRAQATTGQPIALGYLMMIGLAMHCFVAGQKINSNLTRILGLLMVSGLVASISRGPWIGAATALTTYVALSAKALGSIFKFSLATLAVCVIALNSPWADDITAHLPFIGTIETENITYRQNLLEFSIQVITMNPLFGAYDYLYHPALQSLRQESQNGLIDVVNTYIGIALANGMIGLSIFLAAFLIPSYAAWRTMRILSNSDSTERNIGRTLLAAITGILVTLATCSSITIIPTVYWTIIGLTIGYSHLADQFKASQPQLKQKHQTPKMQNNNSN